MQQLISYGEVCSCRTTDPYAVVSFCELSQQTEKQPTTLCPTWDQTLIFDGVMISGPLVTPPVTGEPVKQTTTPPSVVINIFDWDARVWIYVILPSE